jgi:hypothetical protein
MTELNKAKEFLVTALAVAVILFPLSWKVYTQGVADGVARYKRSRQFMLTLESMYRFGVADGCTDDHLCDLAGFPAEEGGNR